MKVAFTGHRKIQGSERLLREKLYNVLADLCEKGADEFFCGGAIGFDTVSAQTVIDLREEYDGIKLHLILPCCNEEQTKNWSDRSKQAFCETLMLADEIEYIGKEYTNDCMKKRNSALIAAADICVAYFDGENYRSGTAQTVRMAQKKGIELINIY